MDYEKLTKSQLIAMLERIDRHAGPADTTCAEPGIPLGEACRRTLVKEKHPAFFAEVK